jgi:hypothetical protein
MIPMHKIRLHGLWLFLAVSTVGAKTNWNFSHPFHPGGGIIYANNRFILHTSYLSEGYQSKDGLAWSSFLDTGLAGDPTPTRVVFLEGRFHAFCIPNGEAYLTSADGLHWTNQPLPVPCSFSDMTWGQEKFVGMSNCTDSLVATSPDGINWTKHNTGTSESFDRVCYGNGVFVAMSHFGAMSVSSDGIAWQRVPGTSFHPGATRLNGDIRFGNGCFVIVGDGGRVYRSTDGMVWTEEFPLDKSGNFYSLEFAEGQFVAIGDAGGRETGFRSQDGLVWNKLGGNYYGKCSLAYGNGRFLAVSGLGTAYSDDSAANWRALPARNGSYLSGAAYTGQEFIVVGENGSLATSPDGLGWTERDAGVTAGLWGAVWGNNRAVVFGTSGTILTSTDLAEWNNLIDPRLNFQSVVFGGSTFVGITGTARIYASSDGVAWDSVYAAPAGQKLGPIAYGNGTFLVCDITNAGSLLRSTDGHAWTRVQNDAIGKPLGGFIVYGKDDFLLSATNGGQDTLYRTTDGSDVRPIRVSVPVANIASPFRGSMAYGQGYYMTTTYSGSDGILVYSADGITWQFDESDRSLSHGIISGGGKILRMHNSTAAAVSITSRFDPVTTSIPVRRSVTARGGRSPGKGMIDAAGKTQDRTGYPAHGMFFIRNR